MQHAERVWDVKWLGMALSVDILIHKDLQGYRCGIKLNHHKYFLGIKVKIDKKLDAYSLYIDTVNWDNYISNVLTVHYTKF